MSPSARTNKLASALLLLKKDPLMTLKLLGYWVATVVFALQMLLAAGGELGGAHDIVQIRPRGLPSLRAHAPGGVEAAWNPRLTGATVSMAQGMSVYRLILRPDGGGGLGHRKRRCG
jgi:hypothetical protein